MVLRSILIFTVIICLGILAQSCDAQDLKAGEITKIYFDDKDFPPTLYTMFTGQPSTATLQVRLPDDYTPEKNYPLLLYIPGLNGKAGGNIQNAVDIGGTEGCITASLPLFKKHIDPTELGQGIIISFEDYPRLSECYRIMLNKLFELVPNIDFDQSAAVGYSNGAIALSVLVSCHDEFILEHFKSFCFVDQGMFHLTDLHKSLARDCGYLILAGGLADYGRELKVEQCKLLYDSWQLLKIDLQYAIMKDVGHELEPFKDIIGRWFWDKEYTIPTEIEADK